MMSQTSIPLPKTSRPAERAMNHVGITTLNQLTSVTEAELLRLHGMGPKAIRILKASLEEHGLTFANAKE
ncbi:DNA-binding protein [Paenibacillus sp. MY03]|uniref:DNA-binding protein n=1 Tax=Paenibacillus sp. MY03 TaxID=302980 RepID=UPI001C501E2D|nr:DNA-binding protein [Paenibacillus sp. MY03]